jgi:hypothetical protein
MFIPQLTGVKGVNLIKNPLEPTYFNQLVTSSGQPMKWWKGTQCSCAGSQGVPKFDCPRCKGYGYLYSTQDYYLIENRYNVNGNMVNLGTIDKVITVIDPRSSTSIAFRQENDKVYLNTAGLNNVNQVTVTVKHERITKKVSVAIFQNPYLMIQSPLENDVSQVSKIYANNFLKKIPLNEMKFLSRDISGVNRLFISKQYRSDLQGKEILVEYNSVEPLNGSVMAIQSRDVVSLGPVLESGDTMVSYPSYVQLNNGDLLLTLTSIRSRTYLILKNGLLEDKLPVFGARSIMISTDTSKYIEGVDYFLKDDTTVTWEGNRPNQGETMQVNLTYCAMYRIIGSMPSSRGHQSRLFPEKVLAKELTEVGFVKEVL